MLLLFILFFLQKYACKKTKLLPPSRCFLPPKHYSFELVSIFRVSRGNRTFLWSLCQVFEGNRCDLFPAIPFLASHLKSDQFPYTWLSPRSFNCYPQNIAQKIPQRSDLGRSVCVFMVPFLGAWTWWTYLLRSLAIPMQRSHRWFLTKFNHRLALWMNIFLRPERFLLSFTDYLRDCRESAPARHIFHPA